MSVVVDPEDYEKYGSTRTLLHNSFCVCFSGFVVVSVVSLSSAITSIVAIRSRYRVV